MEKAAHAIARALGPSCIIAGSDALHRYLGKPSEWAPGDYDLWHVGGSWKMDELLKRALAVLVGLGHTGFTATPKSDHCHTLAVKGHKQTIQLIHVTSEMATTVTELLDKFDLDICRVAYRVDTPGFLLGETFSTTAVNKREPARLNENASRSSTLAASRAEKYRKRGFEVKLYKGPRYEFALSGAAETKPPAAGGAALPSCNSHGCQSCTS